jgi:hypothetical protein
MAPPVQPTGAPPEPGLLATPLTAPQAAPMPVSANDPVAPVTPEQLTPDVVVGPPAGISDPTNVVQPGSSVPVVPSWSPANSMQPSPLSPPDVSQPEPSPQLDGDPSGASGTTAEAPVPPISPYAPYLAPEPAYQNGSSARNGSSHDLGPVTLPQLLASPPLAVQPPAAPLPAAPLAAATLPAAALPAAAPAVEQQAAIEQLATTEQLPASQQPPAAPLPPEPADEAESAAPPRRRRATKRRLPTQKIFSDLATQAAIPATAYAIGEDVDGAMCLVRTDEGFEVFNSSAGSRHEVRVFTDEESAYFYLFGVLVADAVRTGALAPRE